MNERTRRCPSFAQWQESELTDLGRYRGESLSGFPYATGEYIPVNMRYSAWLEWSWAKRAGVAYTNFAHTSPRGDAPS